MRDTCLNLLAGKVFRMAPFDSMGGFRKMFQLFGTRTDPLIAKLSEALAS